MSLSRRAYQANSEWDRIGLGRTLHNVMSLSGSQVEIDSRMYTLFSSSDYLGLSQHPEVASAAHQAMLELGVGSTGSRLTTGNTRWHCVVEYAVSQFVGSEDSVFFATGYQANLSAIQAVSALSEDLTIFSDRLNHASIIDGCRLSRVPVQLFDHNNHDHLAQLLKARATKDALVISDGLFSMDGDIVDLPALLKVCKENGAWSMIDDAHAIGTVGKTGRGTVEYWGSALPDLLVVTASKALGVEGGFVCCSAPLAYYLRNRARSFVFSTAAPPSSAAAIVSALKLIDAPLRTLRENVAHFRALLDLPDSPSPIVPILVGDEREALDASRRLRDDGFWVPAIRFPTVARGKAILRVTITAHHSKKEIEQLARCLGSLLGR